MVLAVSIGVGILLGILMLRNLEVGETWDDWRAVDSPNWFIAAQALLVAALIAGVVTSQPVLIGVPAGFCIVFLTFGISRFLRRTDEEKQIDVEIAEELEEPTSWRLTLALAAFGAVIFPLGAALLADARGGELIYIAIIGAVLCALYNWFSDAVERWFGRRGL